MEKIKLDMGQKAYRLGGGVLRFNPADPNVYDRFSKLPQKLKELEGQLGMRRDADPVSQLVEADRELKAMLGWVFGPGNDFDAMLEGMNLLAVAGNGKSLLANLLDALEPMMVKGAEVCANAAREEALRKARERRGEL